MKRDADFAYLEVYRPVGEAAVAADRLRTVARSIISEQSTDRLQFNNGEGLVIADATYPYCQVYDANDLILPFLMRKDPFHNHPETRFASARQRLRGGMAAVTKNKSRRQGTDQAPATPPITDVLYPIQLRHDFPNRDRVEVPITSIGHQFDESDNGSHELTLVPDLNSEAGRMLVEQAKETARVIGQISKRVAYPNSGQSLGIPFASIREGIDPSEYGHFLKEVSESLLPLVVTVRDVKVR